MKNLILSVFVVLLFELILSECANPRPPQGGPIDSLPPLLIETFPPQGTVNFKEQEITLTFDEYVNADKLTANLIITPNVEIKYKTLIKKNELLLKFEEPFPDSTTITLNFFDGVTDIHEKTPAVNLVYVFSTGNFLDSMIVSGNVYDLMKDSPRKKVIIGLYPFTDTLDIFTTKPTYFTSSDEEGNFKISNIKNEKYKIVAFADDNRNLIFDASKEPYGFLAEPIVLDSNKTKLNIPIINGNAAELILISSRALGNHFDIKYSKGFDSIKMKPLFEHNPISNAQSLRLYMPIDFDLTDSTQTIIHAQDSLGNSHSDTVFVKFIEGTSKFAEFVLGLKPNTEKIDRKIDFTLNFNKPVKYFDSSLIHFAKDSTIIIPLDPSTNFNWNKTYTELQFSSTVDTTEYFHQQQVLLNAKDTILTDTTNSQLRPDSTLIKSKGQIAPMGQGKAKKTSQKIKNAIDLNIEKGTFISIEDDTLSLVTKTYSFIKPLETGVIFLTISTNKPSYFVQLIDEQYNVIKEVPGESSITFSNLLPAKYGIRILIDDNEDGHWSKGNILQNEEPESLYLLEGFTAIRANWENPLDISF